MLPVQAATALLLSALQTRHTQDNGVHSSDDDNEGDSVND